MRIAQVAPLTESVPPQLYGGTERVVAYLTDELVRLGHDVTLFASGDSRTAGRLMPIWPRALRLDGACRDSLAPHLLMLEEVAKRAREFDVVHFHQSGVSQLITSISNAQREPLPDADWIGTVYHGLPVGLLPFHPEPGKYLAFLGRIAPEKRVDRAISIATGCNLPLKIAAKVDPADRGYFEREIRHLLSHPLVEFIGEIDEQQKGDFLGGAMALLFPIDWPEPFGLVMIESLACGVPVIAFRGGSVPEVVDHGVTGFVVDTVEQAIDATRQVHLLDRRRCRAVFERRFSVSRMTADHVELYEMLAGHKSAGEVLTGAL